MKAKLASMLMLISFVQRVASQNPCHPNCSPYGCHGPTEFNCDVCSGNSVLDIDTCVCKPGWFSVSGRCDTYVPNCKEIQISGGVVSCLSCISVRDTFDGTSCTRSNPIFFLRSTTLTYTASAQDKTDANFFVANQCLSVGPTGKCEQCYSGGSVNGAGACVYIATTCGNFDLAGTCTKARTYYYLQTSSPLTTEMCFGACKTCVDGRFGSCLSCPRFFYFKLNSDSNLLGNCYLCHPSCDRCVGPLITDCTSVQNAFYIDRVNAATMNQVLSCPAGCSMCNSPTDCLWCDSGKISVDGICSGLSNTITGCLYQTRTTSPLKDTCLKFTAAYITATDHKGYTMNTNTAVSKCSEFRFFQGDRVTLECMSCAATYLLKNGLCLTTSCSLITNCWLRTELTTTSCICLSCSTGFVLSRSKTSCGSSCAVGETIVEEQGISVCTPCPARCSQCIFQDSKLKCVVCEPSYALYKDSCMSQVCGDGIITLNKECDPMLTPTTCTSDCLLRSISECPNDTDCSRQIFQLTSVSANRLAFKVTQRFSDKVDFSFNPNIMYDTTDPAAQQFFCGRIFTLISDPSAICTFNPTASIAYFDVSRSTMASLVGQTSTIINTAAITVSRKYISQLAFTISPTAAVSVSIDHVSVSFLITTAPVAAAHQDLQLTYELLDPAVCVTSVAWTVTSAKINLVDQPQTITDSNSDLSAGTPAAGYKIGASRLQPDLGLDYTLVVTLCDATTTTASSSVTFVSNPVSKIFALQSGKGVAFLGAGHTVELLFSSALGLIDTAQVIVKFAGTPAASDEFELVYFGSTQKMVLKAKPNSPALVIQLEVGYPGYLSEYVILKRSREELLPALSISLAFMISQPIVFWTSLGPESTYQTVCFSKSTSLRLFTTPSVPSNFINQLNQSVGVQDSVSLQIILKRGGLQAIFSFDVQIEVGAIPIKPLFTELLLSTLYRDGSTSHLSSKTVSWGFPQANWVNSLQLPPTTSATVRKSDGIITSMMTLANSGNKIVATPALSSSIASRPISVSLNANYMESSGTYRQTRSLLAVYSSVAPVAVISEISGAVSYSVDFEISVSFDSVSDLPNIFDGRQSDMTISLQHSGSSLLCVPLPSNSMYTQLSLHGLVFRVGPAVRAAVDVFDRHAFVYGNMQSLTTTRSWTESNSDLFTQWKTNLLPGVAAFVASTSDTDKVLAKLALHAFEANHLWLACTSAEVWCTAQHKEDLAATRWDLFDIFKNSWNAITDKVLFQNWKNSVLKSGFLDAITTDSTKITDTNVDWIAQELTRESNYLISGVQSKRLLYPRISFGLVESMKPLLTLTLSNLDQHTSAVSHLFQLYVLSYQSFSSGDACSKTLNDVFKSLLYLNELRLLRYTLPSNISFFENELLLAGGLTLIEPIPQTQLIWVGTKVAVELKNIAFDPQLDSYELSVIVMKDSFFDSLGKLLDKFNLTSSLNKSRTSVGFTNNFELVYPKVTASSEINVYRSEDECRGTPCNINKQLTSGAGTIILCECLSETTPTVIPPAKPPSKPTPPPPSTNPLTNFTTSLGDTFTGIGSKTEKGANCLFGAESECVKNKRVWLSSVSIIFLVMTVLSSLACWADLSYITPRALAFSCKSQLSMAVSNCVSDLTPETPETKLQVASDVPLERNPSDQATVSSSDSISSMLAGLPKPQSDRIISLIQRLPSSVAKKELLTPEILTPLKTWAKFKLVAWYTHSIASVFTSQCRLHARKTSIFLLYLRSVYELALSMFFTLDIDQQSHNYAQKLALRCFYSVMIVGALIPVVKKLVKGDNTLNMHALWCCACKSSSPLSRKASEDTIAEPVKQSEPETKSKPMPTSVRPTFKTRNRSWNNQFKQPASIQRVSPASSMVLKDRNLERRDLPPLHTDGPTLDRQPSIQSLMSSSGGTPPKNHRFGSDENRQTEDTQNTNRSRLLKLLLIFTGYSLMYGLLIISILVIMAVSKMNDDSGNWPFGYWYLIQFLVSSTFGSIPSILLQYFWLSLRVEFLNKTAGDPPAETPWTARPHFFINNDVHSLADVIALGHEREFPTPAEEIRPVPPA